MKITVNYKSARWIVVLPALVFILLGLVIFPYIVFIKWNIMSGWGTAITVLIGLPLAGFITRFFYYLVSIPVSSQKKIELELLESSLNWIINNKKYSIDFNKKYGAAVFAGISIDGKNGARIDLADSITGISISAAEISQAEVKQSFPDQYFINPSVALAGEGAYGVDLNCQNSGEKELFQTLIKTLWKFKDNNLHYQVYSTFPWYAIPGIRNKSVQLLDVTNRNDLQTMESFKAGSSGSVEDEFTQCWFNSDYILIPVNVSFTDITKDIIVSQKNKMMNYYLMPLGYIDVHEYRWSGASGNIGRGHYIYFSGELENGEKVKSFYITYPIGPIDYTSESKAVKYLQVEYLKRFIQLKRINAQ